MSLSSVENKTRRIRYVSCPTYTPNGIIISCNVRYSSRCTTYNASIEFVAKPFTDYGWESCFPFFQNSNSRVHNCSGGITLRSSSPNGSNGTIAPFLHRDLSIFCQTVQHQCVRGKASISLLVMPLAHQENRSISLGVLLQRKYRFPIKLSSVNVFGGK